MAWRMERVYWLRLWGLLLGSLLGAGLGMLGDVVAVEPLYFPPRSVADWVGHFIGALILSPLAVPIGAAAAFDWMPHQLNLVVALFGLCFWPVYAVLAWRWMKTGAESVLIALVLWCVQGFFQVLHRLEVIMSV
jgi:hypothetical protein